MEMNTYHYLNSVLDFKFVSSISNLEARLLVTAGPKTGLGEYYVNQQRTKYTYKLYKS